MSARMMHTVQQSCSVQKQMGLAQKHKLPMCKKSIFVILMALAYISITMIQPIAMKIKPVLRKSILKTVRQAILRFVLLLSCLILKKACSCQTVSLKGLVQNVKRKISMATHAKYVVRPIMRQSY